MAHAGRWAKNLFTRPPSPTRKFPTTDFKVINGGEKLEEENWEWYNKTLFYPVRIGEVFESRYQVVGKLGYGSSSTVWLCRDLKCGTYPEEKARRLIAMARGHKYVTLKVCEQNSPTIRRELAAYNRLNTITSNKPGALLVRELLDSFKFTGAAGEYHCLIHEPLGMSIETLRQLSPGRKLPQNLFKVFLIHLLQALDFLHADAEIIHGDLQARNIHLRIEEESILQEFELAELNTPSLRKVDRDRVIYESRGLRRPQKPGRPVLCDFGEARLGTKTYTDDIQPYVYRAPEVILDIPWTYSVDVWNFGVLIWDLFEDSQLFNARDTKGDSSSLYHMAELVAILGPPPRDFLRRTETSREYFDDSGNWKGAIEIPDISLEHCEERLDGEDKTMFLDFLRKTLQWVPEKRLTAGQLLHHPYLSQ